MSVWNSIVGQQQVVEQLSAVAAGDPRAIAQSWLICGPPGSGRSNMARAFAAALESPDHGLGDELTPVSRQVLAGSHPDVTVLATDKVTISIDEVRSLIATSEQMPSTAPWRIIIIEDVDRMLERTTNVLLKEIEEPSEHTIWLLCAPSAQDVLPTIRSRTRIVNLAVPSAQAVAEFLQKKGYEPHLAERAARLAEGHIGVAELYAKNAVEVAGKQQENKSGKPGNPSKTGKSSKAGKASPKRSSSEKSLLEQRDDLVVGVLNLQRASDAVLLAGSLIADAQQQATEEVENRAAEAQSEFRRVNGLEENDRIPPALRSAYNALAKKDELKRRATRRSRDVLDRALNTVSSIYRDVAVLQNNAEDAVGLINRENREAITELSVRLSRDSAVRRLDDIATARRRLNGNGNPTLVFEALFCALIP